MKDRPDNSATRRTGSCRWDRSLRVVHVVSGDLWAGAEVQVRNLLAAQRRREDVVAHAVVLNEGRLARELRELEIPVRVLAETRHGFPALLRRLRQAVQAWRIDLVHTHRRKENILGGLATWLAPGVESVRTVHGAPERIPARFDIRRRATRGLDRWLARHVQACTVAVSEELAGKLATELAPKKMQVIANSIDEATLQWGREPARRSPPGDRAQPVRVAFFGRLVPVKRVDLVLDIAELLAQRRAQSFRFDVFGEGPLRDSLEAQIRARGLAGSVHLAGFVDEPAREMAQHDLLLVTSDHEGLPTAVLEAMAVGLPVLSRAVGAIPAVLGQGAYGTVLTDPTATQFVEHLLAYERDPDDYQRLAEHGRAAVAAYSPARMAQRYTQVYLDSNRRRSVAEERV
jgi:glycosyltransferase involved in cell wall biosynthesis